MKYRLPLSVTVILVALFSSVRLAAQAAAATTPPPPELPAPVVKFNEAFARVSEKVKAGPVTAEDIGPELQEMESILAQYSGQKIDSVANLYLLLARVYVEVLEDYPKGLALMKQVKAEYPKVYKEGQVARIVAMTEERMANDNTLYIGKVFPTFSEKDLHGEPISTAKLKGKVVLVSFWASWSGQCISDLATQAALYEKYHAKGFEIIGISVDEERNDLKALLEKKNIPWQQYCDGRGWKGRIIRQYGISSVPFSCLLDTEGHIMAKNLRGASLEQKLDKIFGG